MQTAIQMSDLDLTIKNLKTLVRELPKFLDREKDVVFDMKVYNVNYKGTDYEQSVPPENAAKGECGTNMCAMGCVPYLKGMLYKKEMNFIPNYNELSDAAFPFLNSSSVEDQPTSCYEDYDDIDDYDVDEEYPIEYSNEASLWAYVFGPNNPSDISAFIDRATNAIGYLTSLKELHNE